MNCAVKGSGVIFGHRCLPIVRRCPKMTSDPFKVNTIERYCG